MLEKYKYTDTEIKQILSSINILVDSREQQNIHILKYFDDKKIPYIVKKLDFGDYSCCINAIPELSIPRSLFFDRQICIERKNSIDELVGNFADDRDRIESEFLRHKGKMQLVIEDSSYKDIYEGNYQSKYATKSLLATMHTFSQRYDIPFIFLDKEYTARYIYYTFYYYLRNLIK
jgi:ERCC4-type nuclease